MKLVVNIHSVIDVKYIVADFGVRFWEDALVNGKDEDNDNPTMTCIENNRWTIVVDIEKGRLINWPINKNISGRTYYKVCDDGEYTLLDENHNEIIKISSYVPSIFSIDDSGFGDYVYLTINEEGYIKNWSCTSDDLKDMIASNFNNN